MRPAGFLLFAFPLFSARMMDGPRGGGRPHAMPRSRTLTPGGCAPCAAAPGPAERRAKSERGPPAPRVAPVERRRARLCRAVNSFTPGPWQPVALSRQEDVCDRIQRAGWGEKPPGALLPPAPQGNPGWWRQGQTRSKGGQCRWRGRRTGCSRTLTLLFSRGVGLGASLGARALRA